MSDFLKDNWFVAVIAIIIISFVAYFIYDGNRYNVSTKKADGKDVVASTDIKNITADDFYTEASEFDGSLLYNIYRNYVVDQSIKTTDDMKSEAKTLQTNITGNAQNYYGVAYKDYIGKELASYGFNGFEDLERYCLLSVKEKEMNAKYIDEHFDELSPALGEKKSRTISIISMNVTNPDALTEDEQKKKDNIDNALNNGSFADCATAFSEDQTTASQEGFYGYIDTDDLGNSTLDTTVIQAALDMEKDGTSDWITVTNPTYGTAVLYRVHVDETDVNEIHKSKNEDVTSRLLSAILSANAGLDVKIVQHNAEGLKIEFKDEEAKTKFESYLKSIGGQVEEPQPEEQPVEQQPEEAAQEGVE